MADKNPSQNNEPATGVKPNKAPSNHEEDGEAYLMFSGQVSWKASTENSNVNADDIYTIQTRNNANPATPADLEAIHDLFPKSASYRRRVDHGADRRRPCGYVRRPAIGVRGELLVCCHDMFGELPLGNVLEAGSLRVLCESNTYRRAVGMGRRRRLPICKGCN